MLLLALGVTAFGLHPGAAPGAEPVSCADNGALDPDDDAQVAPLPDDYDPTAGDPADGSDEESRYEECLARATAAALDTTAVALRPRWNGRLPITVGEFGPQVPEGGTARVHASHTARKVRTLLGKSELVLLEGERKPMAFHLNRKGRKLLERRRKLKVLVTVTLYDEVGGITKTASKRVRVRYRR